jgi:hypothetical protein
MLRSAKLLLCVRCRGARPPPCFCRDGAAKESNLPSAGLRRPAGVEARLFLMRLGRFAGLSVTYTRVGRGHICRFEDTVRDTDRARVGAPWCGRYRLYRTTTREIARSLRRPPRCGAGARVDRRVEQPDALALGCGSSSRQRARSSSRRGSLLARRHRLRSDAAAPAARSGRGCGRHRPCRGGRASWSDWCPRRARRAARRRSSAESASRSSSRIRLSLTGRRP